MNEPSNADLKAMLESIARAQRDDTRATAERFGEVKAALKGVDDRSIQTRDMVHSLNSRVDLLEKDSERNKRYAQDAMRSSSDLSAHVKQTEEATRRAVDHLASQVRTVDEKVDQMSRDQTPLLKEIRDEQAAKKIRDQVAAEKRVEEKQAAAAEAAKHKRRVEQQTIWIPVVIAVITLAGTYLSTRQAVHDSAPSSSDTSAPTHT